MADVKWIKIVTDIFDDEKMLLIESLPEADSIIVIWFKLLTLAGKQNNSGVFMLNDKIPYTDEMFATIFRRKKATVQMALKTFCDFGMIEIINNAVTIPNWSKHQSIISKNEYMKNYMRNYRKKQKELVENTEIDNGFEEEIETENVNSKVNSKFNSKLNVKKKLAYKNKNKEKEERIKNKNKETDIIIESVNSKVNTEEKEKISVGRFDDESISNSFAECVKKIENLIGCMLSRADIERLQEQIESTGQDTELVLYVYKMCAENNRPKNSSYITTILKNWYIDYKIKTVEDLKKVEEKRKQDKRKLEFTKNKKYIEEKDILTNDEKLEKIEKDMSESLKLLENF